MKLFAVYMTALALLVPVAVGISWFDYIEADYYSLALDIVIAFFTGEWLLRKIKQHK